MSTREIGAASWKPLALPAALGCAGLTGVFYFLAFPGVDCWPLAFVTWLPLLRAMEGQSVRRATLLGWVAGFTMTTVGFYWLLGLLRQFSGFPTPICWLLLLLLCGYQGGRIALLAWLYARAEARQHARMLGLLCAFAASELIFPLIFPWSFAAVVHGQTPLLQLAELGGPIAVGLPLVAFNFGAYELARSIWQRRPPARSSWLLLAMPLCSAAFGWLRMGQVERGSSLAASANIGLVQANLELEGTREQAEAGLRRHLQLTRELAQQGPLDLVVWSETSVPNAMLESAAGRRLREEVTGELGVPSLVGAVLVRPVPDARRYVLFNSAMLSDARGELLGRYDKHFRLPFGEYLPFGDTFPIIYEWSPASGRFAAGESREALKLGSHRLSTLICYEDVVAEYVRSAVRENQPDLLVNLTNDGWFGDTTEPWIHLALAQFRAVEHRRYLVRATNTGVSAIIDPLGRVVAKTSTFVPATLRGRVAWLEGNTLYGLLGNTPWWIATLISLLWAFSPARKRISGPATP